MARLRPLCRTALFGAAVVTALLSTAQAQCFFPNGMPAANDVPCRTGVVSHCCNNQSLCLANGFCTSATFQPWTLSRGSCTDQSWGSECPSRCRGQRDNPGGGIAITLFSFVSNVASYCCGIPAGAASGGNIICPNGGQPFTIDDANVIFGRAFLANTSQTNAPGSGSGSGSGLSPGNRTTAPANATVATGPSPAAVGAGVGVPLGVLAISLLAWALWERRRRKAQVAALEAKVAAAGEERSSHSTAPPDGHHGPGHTRNFSYYSKQEPSSAGGFVQSHATGSTLPTYHARRGSQREHSAEMSPSAPGRTQRAELGTYRDTAQELE